MFKTKRLISAPATLFLVLTVVLPGLSQAAGASPRPLASERTPQQSTKRADSAASTAPAAAEKSLLTTADSVLADMSRITGLPIKAPLRKQLVSRAEVERYLTDNLHSEYSPAEMRGQEGALKAFGLVPPDFDLEQFLIRFCTEQAAGFYDPRRKTMFMADWVQPNMQKLVLAHELTHALQDQNFGLEKYEFAERSNDDATAARQAVVEGYATAAMIEETMPGADLAHLASIELLMESMMTEQMKQYPVFSQAPFFLRFEALFPYTDGLDFIDRGLAAGGWKGLTQLFHRPPETTRDIFQPQLYFASSSQSPPGEAGLALAGAGLLPSRAAAAAPLLPHPDALTKLLGFKLVEDNVMGELGYYGLLGQLISRNEAQHLAPGWRADRYLVYEGAGKSEYTLVARVRWASSDIALGFFRDYRTILEKKYPGLSPAPHATAEEFTATTPSGVVILLRRGEEALWAEGVPRASTAGVLNFLRSL